MKRPTAIIAIVIAAAAATAAGNPPQLVEMSGAVTPSSDPNSPAGIWQFGGDGAIFEIRPQAGRHGVYDLWLLESPDLSAPSGIIFGHMESTGRDNYYDVTLYEALKAGKRSAKLSKTKSFIFNFNPREGSVVITEYRTGPRLSLRRWIPYLFRVAVDRTESRPSGIDGARRISPPSVNYPIVL